MANYELNVKINGVEQSVSTIGELESALKATNQELANTEKNSKAFNQLQRQAQNIEGYLSALTQDASQFNSQLKQVSASSNQLGTSLQQTADAAEQLNNAQTLQNLSQNTNQAVNSADSLRAQLRQTVQELQSLEPGSQRFVELSQRAGQLRDQIADTNQVVGALAGNTTERLGTALSNVVGVGITGLQGVVGGMKLFGVESEESRKVLEKLQGLLFLTQAIQGLGGLADSIQVIKAGFTSLTATREADLAVQETQIAASGAEAEVNAANTTSVAANTLATEGHAAATTADAAATEAATVAQEGFTAALLTNPITLIVVGLTALIAALFIFTDGEKKAKKSIEETTAEQQKQIASQKKLADQLAEITFQRARLLAFEEKNEEKRRKLLQDAEQQLVADRAKNQQKEIQDTQIQFEKILSETRKFSKAFTGEIKELRVQNREPYDVVEVITGYKKLGEAELKERKKTTNNAIAEQKRKLAAELKGLQEGTPKYLATEAKFQAEIAKIRANGNILLLKTQLDFLAKSNEDDKKAKAEQIKNLIKTLRTQRDLIVQSYLDQAKLQVDNSIKLQEDEEKRQQEANERYRQLLERRREEAKRKYEEITKAVQDRLKEAQDIETKYFEDIQKLGFKTKQEEIAFEEKKEKERIAALVKFRQEEVAKSVLSTKDKNKAIEDLTRETNEANQAIENFYAEKRRLLGVEDLKQAEEKTAKLRQLNDILQKEISFGDQSVFDQKLQFNLRENELKIAQLDLEKGFNKENIFEYTKYLKEREDLVEQSIELRQKLETAQAEAENERKLAIFRDQLKQSFGEEESNRQERYAAERLALDEQYQFDISQKDLTEQEKTQIEAIYISQRNALNLKYNTEYYKTDVQNLKNALASKSITQEEYDAKIQKLDEDYTNNSKSNATSLFDVILNGRKNLELKKKEIDQKSAKDEIDLTQKTQKEINEIRIKALQEYVDQFAKVYNQIVGLVSSIREVNRVGLENQITDQKIYNEQKTDEINRQYNDEITRLQTQYQQGIITQEQYNAATEALEKQRTSVIDGLAQDLRDKEFALKKKSFEDDKKLKRAQAIIQGIQGAVAAFAGAFTSYPPPYGAIVGGIFAAIVAATTAAQVKAINNVKFDSTGASPITQPSSSALPANGGVANGQQLTQAAGGGFTGFNQNVFGPPTTLFNQQGGQSGGQNLQKVYVLESDITNAQQRVRVLENNSTFG